MKIRIFLLTASAILICFTYSWSQTALQWRTFKSNNNSWLVSPSGLLVFSSSNQAIRPMAIDPARSVTIINDVVELDGYLYISTDAGVYKIDMNTQSSERISFPGDQIVQGKITIDMDYMWLAAENTLHRFDILGAEWQSFKIPGDNAQITGISSNGDDVVCIGNSVVNTFNTSTEKWNTTPIGAAIPDSTIFFPGKNTLNMIDRNKILRYTPTSFSWETTVAESEPVDYIDEDSVIYYVNDQKVFKLTTSSNMIRPLDIPQTGKIYAITKSSDSLFLAAEKRIIKYDVRTEKMDFVEYEPGPDPSTIEKIVFHGNFRILVYDNLINIYDVTNRSWKKTSREDLRQKVKVITWDDKGFVARYAPGYQTSLTGSFEETFSLKLKDFKYDTTVNRKIVGDSIIRDTIIKKGNALLGYTIPSLPLMNLNLRTTAPGDRFADMFFDNTSISTVPKKGIYYQGNRDDRLNSIKAGTTSSNIFSSATIPGTDIEGGTAIVESKKRIGSRDRKVIRATAGSGLITSKTQLRTLPYRSDGTYYLLDKKIRKSNTLMIGNEEIDPEDVIDISDSTTSNRDTTRIVPGSVKVLVDGETLDSTEYTFYSSIGLLQFTPNAPVDPVSVITIQYRIQTVPDGGISEFELFPKRHFGQLHFGSLSVSPKEWISGRVGFAGLDADGISSPGKTSPMVNASIPLEIRKDRLFLKFNPEYTYNTETGAKAGSASLQSRVGKRTGLVFNGMFADDNYLTTDTLTYGYGAVTNQYDFTLSHDVKNEVPLSYYQHRREAQDGVESRYSAKAGAHYQGFPFLDLTLSRTSIEHLNRPDSEKTAFDSLFSTKDKMKFRLYETSSKLLEQLISANRVSYDLSHSEYRYESEGKGWRNGRMSTAELAVAPIQPVIISGNLLYQGDIDIDSMPSSIFRPYMELQTIDWPKGADINATYHINYGKYADEDSSTDTITRTINLTLKPGSWTKALRWFSFKGALSNNIYSAFNYSGPNFFEMVTGKNSVAKNSTSLRSFGFNVFPTDEILFRNSNEFSKLDTINYFKTTNDLQIWLGSRNFWQAIVNYSSKNETYNTNFLYDRTWSPWLRTSPNLAINSLRDSIGNTMEIIPSLKVNLNLQNFRIVKFLSNTHDFKLIWDRKNSNPFGQPDISYTFSLTFIILPNIQVNTFETFVFGEGGISAFQSQSSLIMNF